jgi:hypothetical protein
MFWLEGPSSGDLQILKLQHWIVSRYGTILYHVLDFSIFLIKMELVGWLVG